MPEKLSQELNQAKMTAIEIGRLQLTFFEKELKVIRKSPKELVSNVDMECQNLAYEMLKNNYSYPVLSEEKRRIKDLRKKTHWIVDPLDGSHNFISGLPIFGVSIALVSNSEFLVGVIYLPIENNILFAVKGGGAFLNDSKIYVSKNNDLKKSMITYDNILHQNEKIVNNYKSLVNNIFTSRILGSAIYDFSLISQGKIDARIWNDTKIFDYAAGALIVKESGGVVTDHKGNKITLDSKEIVASNGYVHEAILKILNN